MPSKKSSISESNVSTEEASHDEVKKHQGGRLPLNRYVLFFLLAAGGLAADLYTKWYCFKNYFEAEVVDRAQDKHFWIEGILGIQTSTNPGALFGLGSGYSHVFAILSIGALIGILLWLFVFRAAFDRWLTVALGLITGGIMGNLYDRLGLGYLPSYPESIRNNVRDWILFQIEGGPKFLDPWPNFNIADALLVTGAMMLFLHIFLYQDTVEAKMAEGSIETNS